VNPAPALHSSKFSTDYRTSVLVLENHLRDLPADGPQRVKFAPMLDCLRHGEIPAELNDELEKK